jgi:hypothetical protein
MLSYRTATGVGGTVDLTINTISGGLLDRFESYQVLIQQIAAIPAVLIPHVEAKTTTGFTIVGDASTAFSIVVLGTEGLLGGKREGQNRSGRWAKDYCPYCKALKIKALVGSIFTDQVSVGMSTDSNVMGLFPVVFRTLTQSTGIDTDPDTAYVTYRESGQQKHTWLDSMKDATYEMIASPVSAPAGAVPVTITTTIDKDNFIFGATDTVKYDVLVVGQIEQ